jgi:hypothetical protein
MLLKLFKTTAKCHYASRGGPLTSREASNPGLDGLGGLF